MYKKTCLIFIAMFVCLIIGINTAYAEKVGVIGFYIGQNQTEACEILKRMNSKKYGFKQGNFKFKTLVYDDYLLNPVTEKNYSVAYIDDVFIYFDENQKVVKMEFELSAFSAEELNPEQFAKRVIQLPFVGDMNYEFQKLFQIKHITSMILDCKAISSEGYRYDNMEKGYSVIALGMGLIIEKIEININFEQKNIDFNHNNYQSKSTEQVDTDYN